MTEYLEMKLGNRPQRCEQATKGVKRQQEEAFNELTRLSSHQAKVEKSVQESKSLEGKVLKCELVTTNMADEIRAIGVQFEGA